MSARVCTLCGSHYKGRGPRCHHCKRAKVPSPIPEERSLTHAQWHALATKLRTDLVAEKAETKRLKRLLKRQTATDTVAALRAALAALEKT